MCYNTYLWIKSLWNYSLVGCLLMWKYNLTVYRQTWAIGDGIVFIIKLEIHSVERLACVTEKRQWYLIKIIMLLISYSNSYYTCNQSLNKLNQFYLCFVNFKFCSFKKMLCV